ncbi:glycosyltransferase [Phormidium pseudopriestleyi FRX01]|uniref:Glycosyltransferase n=1 Tax=Phormidium pseudopriestleyi FRX01 TaxID=1759528 RepID=A0ABS3FLA4_9CYAN|nr:glycosyltransferase [Phormidium pseudopriestleyi]MBO0347855.1 glycosyltransferase [Phormidium pseudopriestleyi FRX01]
MSDKPALNSGVLYISYDGLLEPLGQSQVFQYLNQLAKEYPITLVTYEKPEDWAKTKERNVFIEKVRAAGIRWIPLRYHQRPTAPATAYDLAVGFLVCIYLVIRYRIKLVHVRSYVPAVLGLLLKHIFGVRFIFDMRGFWVDERIDAEIWTENSRLYKIAKWFERQFLTHADVVVSLTHAGVKVMQKFPYLQENTPRFEVIPTCTNLEIFYPRFNIQNRQDRPFTLGYVGSVGGWYLFDIVLECLKELLEIRPNARLLILNRNQGDYIRNRLNFYGINEHLVELKTVFYNQVAEEMHQMDAGIFFIKPVFSKQASAATKLGEFLGCGIPCLSNDGVGDMTEILEENKAGVILREFGPQAQILAVQQLLQLVEDPRVGDRCVATAHRYFSLEQGVKSYNQIYQSLYNPTFSIEEELNHEKN